MPAAYRRPCRLCRLDQRHPGVREGFPGDTLIVATEPHIIHQMELALPEKNFIGAPGADGNCNCNICPYMALNTMEKLYIALRDLKPRIEIEEGASPRRAQESRPDAGDGERDGGQGDLGPGAR
jgi:quinolinate synthase